MPRRYRSNRSAHEVLTPSVWEEGETDSLLFAVQAIDKPVLRALEKQLARNGFRGAEVWAWGSGMEHGGIVVGLGDEEFKFELREVPSTGFTPNADVTRYTVHGVLAGAYIARRDRNLSHVLLAGADTSLCGRIDIGHLSDLDTMYESEDAYGPVSERGAPSCPTCARRLEKLARTTELVRDPEIGA